MQLDCANILAQQPRWLRAVEATVSGSRRNARVASRTSRLVLGVISALASASIAVGCGSSVEPEGDEMDSGAMAAPDGGAQPGPGPGPAPGPGPGPGSTLPRYPGLSLDCWFPPNSFCNPANNEGCAPDEACDIGSEPDGRPVVACFPPPADARLGEACNNQTGPFCRGGTTCMDGVCMDICCSDTECPAPERCVPLDASLGTLGVCRVSAGPSCQPPGAFCQQTADCCSQICHLGHCH